MEAIIIVDITNLPSKPGVYKFKNKIGEIIYVGASKNLQKRVKSYFVKKKGNFRLQNLVAEIVYIEFEIINSGNHAFLRERELINLHKPKYNVRWMDDKQYPYLVVTTSEKYPRIVIQRNKKINKDLFFEKQYFQLIQNILLSFHTPQGLFHNFSDKDKLMRVQIKTVLKREI